MIKGVKVELIPATLDDRQKIYEWCFQSETTKYHAGPPDHPNIPIPTCEDFYASDDGGYTEYYFTGAKPNDGRGFLIENEGTAIGFISYSAFHLKPAMAELDIWMSTEANCGNGFGVDALISLGDYLHKEMDFRQLIIAPSAKNTRAVRAYEKAGFEKTEKAMHEFLLDRYVPLFGDGDYGADETVILVKKFDR
ncbi:GNAT family N-acetyltransferase [Ruminococcaceae bacterium OttesenSCG-928-I18]|nr:GNAT family N-acetyltransferase [Ruminococcaceae bacterium OttesenSCG-928-I18]